MMLRVELLQALARDVRVYLRGRNVGMPQEQLNDPKIRTVVEKMRRERVPQRMRRDRLRDSGAQGMPG